MAYITPRTLDFGVIASAYRRVVMCADFPDMLLDPIK
jgi:hypothetical protein